MHASLEFAKAVATLRPDLFENEVRLAALDAAPTRPTWLGAIGRGLRDRIRLHLPVRQHAHLEMYPEYNLIRDGDTGRLLANAAILHPEIARQLVPDWQHYTIWFRPGRAPRVQPNRSGTYQVDISRAHYDYIISIVPNASLKTLPCGLRIANYERNTVMINCETMQYVQLHQWMYSAYFDDFGVSNVPHFWRRECP